MACRWRARLFWVVAAAAAVAEDAPRLVPLRRWTVAEIDELTVAFARNATAAAAVASADGTAGELLDRMLSEAEVTRANVLVLGCEEAWVAAAFLAYRVASVTCVGEVVSSHPAINVLSKRRFLQGRAAGTSFNVVFLYNVPASPSVELGLALQGAAKLLVLGAPLSEDQMSIVSRMERLALWRHVAPPVVEASIWLSSSPVEAAASCSSDKSCWAEMVRDDGRTWGVELLEPDDDEVMAQRVLDEMVEGVAGCSGDRDCSLRAVRSWLKGGRASCSSGSSEKASWEPVVCGVDVRFGSLSNVFEQRYYSFTVARSDGEGAWRGKLGEFRLAHALRFAFDGHHSIHGDAASEGPFLAAMRRECVWEFDLPKCHRDAAGGGAVEFANRQLARDHLRQCQAVLEIGGGSGAVANAVQSVLANAKAHVVVQPRDDPDAMGGGLEALKVNRLACGLEYTVHDQYLLPGDRFDHVAPLFDCAVVDCEGCFGREVGANPELFADVRLVQIERDDHDGDSYYRRHQGPIGDLLHKSMGLTLIRTTDDDDPDHVVGQPRHDCCALEVWARLEEA